MPWKLVTSISAGPRYFESGTGTSGAPPLVLGLLGSRRGRGAAAAGCGGVGPGFGALGAGGRRRRGRRWRARQQVRAFVRRQCTAIGKVNRVGPGLPRGTLVVGRTLADVRG